MDESEKFIVEGKNLMQMIAEVIKASRNGEIEDPQTFVKVYRHFLEECLKDEDPEVVKAAESRFKVHFQGTPNQQADESRTALIHYLQAYEMYKNG